MTATFDFKGFAKDLKKQAEEVMPEDIASEHKKEFLDRVYDFTYLAGEAFSKDDTIENPDTAKALTQLISEWTFHKYVDVLQIGARNVQNFKLLHAVGKCRKPVILKRGLASTIREFLLAAEHILYNGNPNVILCERGIRSFDNAFTRNVMDIASVPVIKEYSHLPIIVDPSHGTGQRYLIEPMAKAGLVVGADGVMMEVHHDPENALSDGKQSLLLPMFKEVMKRINKFNECLHYDKACLSANAD